MARLPLHVSTVTTTEIVTTDTSTPVKVDRAKTISVQSVIDVDTPAASTFLAGESEIQTLTFPAKAGATAGDYIVLTDGAGLTWAVSLDVSGSDPEPTGAIWVAVNAARKAHVDISGATDAASVAALVEIDFDALTGASSAFTTDDTAADGTMLFTAVTRGTCTNPVPKNANDSGAGSITASETNPGVASAVSVSANTITKSSHGLTTGLKGQASSTGTLPAGLSTSTDYFVIVVDSNTYKLATSLVNAQAGTAIDITDQGTDGATHTFTATSIAGGSLTLQKSNDYDPITGSGTWDAVESATSITADGDIWISDIDPEYRWVRLSFTLTAGRISASSVLVVKGDI